MNCKQGDLAYIVNGAGSRFAPEPENIGRVVRCLRLHPIPDMAPVWVIEAQGSPLYVVCKDRTRSLDPTAYMEDTNLRPIQRPEAVVERAEAATA